MDTSGDNKREVLRNQSRQFLINTADYFRRQYLLSIKEQQMRFKCPYVLLEEFFHRMVF
jgi:hypothetical protein